MKASQIYLEAAERIANWDSAYCCTAIGMVAGISIEPGVSAAKRFVRLFGPRNHHARWPGLQYDWDYGSFHDDRARCESRQIRILMLCLMAEIARDTERFMRRHYGA